MLCVVSCFFLVVVVVVVVAVAVAVAFAVAVVVAVVVVLLLVIVVIVVIVVVLVLVLVLIVTLLFAGMMLINRSQYQRYLNFVCFVAQPQTSMWLECPWCRTTVLPMMLSCR